MPCWQSCLMLWTFSGVSGYRQATQNFTTCHRVFPATAGHQTWLSTLPASLTGITILCIFTAVSILVSPRCKGEQVGWPGLHMLFFICFTDKMPPQCFSWSNVNMFLPSMILKLTWTLPLLNLFEFYATFSLMAQTAIWLRKRKIISMRFWADTTCSAGGIQGNIKTSTWAVYVSVPCSPQS